jgi:hypothetical protein
MAYTLDCLAQGKTAQAGDMLVQRMKAVETASHSGNWKAAEQMELLPTKSGIACQQELDTAAKQAVKRQTVERALTSRGAG